MSNSKSSTSNAPNTSSGIPLPERRSALTSRGPVIDAPSKLNDPTRDAQEKTLMNRDIWASCLPSSLHQNAPLLLREIAENLTFKDLDQQAAEELKTCLEKTATLVEVARAANSDPDRVAVAVEIAAESCIDLLSSSIAVYRSTNSDLALSAIAIVGSLDEQHVSAALFVARALMRRSETRERPEYFLEEEGDPKNSAGDTHGSRRLRRLALVWAWRAARNIADDGRDITRLSKHLMATTPSTTGGTFNFNEAKRVMGEADKPAFEIADDFFDEPKTMRIMSSPIPGGGRERQQIQKEWSSLQTDNFKLMGNYKNTSDVERKLLARFPHFYPAVKRVLDDIRSTPAHRPWVRFRPLLIVGPPGIGKTIFVETLADLLGIPFEKIDVTGMTDNRLLAGTASGWATAQPCFPVFAMRQRDCANPMILIDGIDRSSGSSKNGDVRRTLEAMTDRRSASTYRDECLLAPVDLSAINWIACANSEDELRGGLLGRFGVVKIDSPTSIHYGRISSSIRTLIEEENELQPGTLPELDQSIEEKLKKQFGKSITPRMLAGIFRKILLTPELFPPPQLH